MRVKAKTTAIAVGVNMGVWKIDEERLQYASHGGFANPA